MKKINGATVDPSIQRSADEVSENESSLTNRWDKSSFIIIESTKKTPDNRKISSGLTAVAEHATHVHVEKCSCDNLG